MNVEEYDNNVKPFVGRINKPHIKLISGGVVVKMKKDALELLESEKLDSLKGIYNLINGFRYEWMTELEKVQSLKHPVKGRINFVGIEEMLSPSGSVDLKQLNSWTIYNPNGGIEKKELSGRFISVDTLGDISVGIFDSGDSSMYFHDFGNSFYSMDLDVFGYFQMALKSNGYPFWQLALVYILYGRNDSSNFGESRYEDFIEEMPVIFEEFSLDEYLELFESLRISKK